MKNLLSVFPPAPLRNKTCRRTVKKLFTAMAFITTANITQPLCAAPPTYIVYSRFIPGSGLIQNIIDLKKDVLYENVKAEEKVTNLFTSLFIQKNIIHNMFANVEAPERNLYAINFKKGIRVRLNGELPPGGRVDQVVFSSKSKYAFYLADQEVKGKFEYYRTPGKKSKPVKLKANLGEDYRFAGFSDPVLSNGKGFTFRARSTDDPTFHLYLSMLKEPVPRRVSIDMPNPAASISGVFMNPRDTGFIYRANVETTHTFDYYYYDIKSFSHKRINLSDKPFWTINQFNFDRQGKNLYYRANYDTPYKQELYKLNLSTFQTEKISPEIPDDRTAGGGMNFDKSGKKLYYTTTAYSPTSATYRLCYLDTKTYENHIVTPPEIDIYSFGLDSKDVVYYEAPDPEITGSSRIYKWDSKTGSASPILSPDVPAGKFYSIQFDPTGEHILMRIKILSNELTAYYYQNLKTGEVILMNGEPYNATTPYMTPSLYFTASRWMLI